MRRCSRVLLVVLAGVMIGGCRDQDSEHAVETVKEFVGALERGDGRAACDRLAEAGVSELLLAAVRARVDPSGLDAPDAERCAIVARRLGDEADGRLSRLRDSAVTSTTVEGDLAVVRTHEGAYEVREVDGRWRLARLDPVVEALTPGAPKRRPVHLTVVRPKLEEPALGAALAGRVDDTIVEISGTLEPPDASLRVDASSGARVQRVEARDARFRIRAALRPGPNRLLLEADAPNRDPTELSIELTRPPP
ncbi:MAG TPA: hypothetical protein VGR11_16970 [Solirubrobacteraceae bacterium]|nr:hypothetical protein [Solirubrobacteraceae bacterium]